MLTMLIVAVIGILVVLIVGGILNWIVQKAPFIPAEFKAAISWGIWAICALIFLVWLVQSVRGGVPTSDAWRFW